VQRRRRPSHRFTLTGESLLRRAACTRDGDSETSVDFFSNVNVDQSFDFPMMVMTTAYAVCTAVICLEVNFTIKIFTKHKNKINTVVF